MASCYVNLRLYEDAITFCDYGLKIDEFHGRSLYNKARAKALLSEFDESQELFKKIGLEKELDFVHELIDQ